MFITALFTIAKTWMQPKCPSTEEWKKKMWYIYTMDYYSAIKMNEIMPFAKTWMHLESVTQSEVSQTEKDKYRMTSLMCAGSVTSVMSDSLQPHGLQLTRLLCPWGFPGKSTGVGWQNSIEVL